MTDGNIEADTDESEGNQPNLMDAEIEVDGLDDDTVAELTESVRIEGPEGEMPIKLLMLDIVVGHKELEEYKESALAITQKLDERIQEAEAAGNDDLVTLLEEVKRSAYGMYLRLHRGDAELMGDRDGKYDGYFEGEDDATA